MKKILSMISVSLLLLLMFSACGSTSTTTSDVSRTAQNSAAASGNAAGKNVTMILKNLTNPFFVSVKQGGEAAAKELGINLTVLAPLKADNNEEQTQMVEQSIVNQMDLVILCPADSNAIVPAVQKLNDAKIPLVDLNTKIGGSTVKWNTFVAIENYDAGFQTVTRLCELMGGKGEIMIIEGVTGAQTSVDRTKGAKDAIAKYPNIKIVAEQSGEYNRAKAMNVVQNLLQASPNVKAIYCCNDEMALGAVEAIDTAGRTGKILVAGCDANADAQKAIKDGKMALSCDSQPYQQGYVSVQTAAKILKGENVSDFVKTEMKVVGKEDIK